MALVEPFTAFLWQRHPVPSLRGFFLLDKRERDEDTERKPSPVKGSEKNARHPLLGSPRSAARAEVFHVSGRG